MKKININHEDLNTLGLVVLFVLVILLFKKKNNQQPNQVIQESQNPTPEEEPIDNYVLKIPKKPLSINNKLSVVCPTLRKGYG